MNKFLLSISVLGMTMLSAQNAADLPYAYGFETSDLDGWTVTNAGEGNNWEVTQASSETPDPSEGEHYMMYTFHDNAANSYLFSKGINLNMNENINLKFDYMGIDAMFPEKMEVLIGTSPSVEAMTTQLWVNEEIGNYPYETASVDFTVPANGVYYIAFRAFSDADQFYLSLDNVRIENNVMSVSDLNNSKINFYPNPVKDILTIENDINLTKVAIYDLGGKLVLSKELNSKTAKINTSSLAKGVYMIRVATKNGEKTLKLIKD